MRGMVRDRINVAAVTLGLMAFLLFGTFGMSHTGMSTHTDGSMSGCPFTPASVICTMSPLEMIEVSQSLFTTLPQPGTASLLALLLSAMFASVIFWKAFSPPRLALAYRRGHLQEYLRPHNFLQEFFSSGILNPKLF